MNEELKKAVKIMESIRKYFTTTVDMFSGKDTYNTPAIFSYTQNYGEAFNKILNLAQDYLSCGEMKERDCTCLTQSVYDYDTRISNKTRKCNNCNFNLAVHQHKLIMLRKQEELREKCKGIPKIIKNSPAYQQQIGLTKEGMESIATALKNELMGEQK